MGSCLLRMSGELGEQILHVVEYVFEVPKIASLDRNFQRTVEQSLDVLLFLVPKVVEQILVVPKIPSHDQTLLRTMEPI